jgi:hypothetical protein
MFHSHYGSSAGVISQIWFDMRTADVGEPLENSDKSAKGFKMFMCVMFFLWVGPKNTDLLVSRFKICKRKIQSDHFWKWIYKMAALKELKVVWPEKFMDPSSHIYCLAFDGVDYAVWEKPSERYNIDSGMHSHKFKKAALRYLFAVDIWESRCVHVSGPVKAGEIQDIELWRRGGLKDKMINNTVGKIAVADRGLQTSEPDEIGMIAVPSSRDPTDLHEFLSRVRCRNELYNGFLAHFKILQDRFHYPLHKHKHVVLSIVVIVQYQMENGKRLFDV